jgi:hypothetical protein
MSWPTRGADRLDQRPILIGLATNSFAVRPQKHGASILIVADSGNGLFGTTCRFGPCVHRGARGYVAQQPQKSRFSSPTGELGLELLSPSALFRGVWRQTLTEWFVELAPGSRKEVGLDSRSESGFGVWAYKFAPTDAGETGPVAHAAALGRCSFAELENNSKRIPRASPTGPLAGSQPAGPCEVTRFAPVLQVRPESHRDAPFTKPHTLAEEA